MAIKGFYLGFKFDFGCHKTFGGTHDLFSRLDFRAPQLYKVTLEITT